MGELPQKLELKLREIVEEHQFVKELQAIEKDSEKADEFIDGAKWALSRRAEIGTQIGKSHVFFLPVAFSSAVGPVVLFYAFDENRVFFLSIRKSSYPPKESEE
jgi:hypothetical protein